MSANCFNEFATDTFAPPFRRNRYLVNRRVTVFATTKVDKANDARGMGQGTRDTGWRNDGNEQAVFLNGFLKCSKFDKPQLMPMLVCQFFDRLQIMLLRQPNLNIHANHPLKAQISLSAKILPR